MAEKKLTTMEQLRALAEKGKLDTLTRIDALLEVITCWKARSIPVSPLLCRPRTGAAELRLCRTSPS